MSIYPRVPVGELVSLRQGFAINKGTKHHMSAEPTRLHLLRIGDMKEGSFSVYVKDTIPKHFIATENDIIYTRTGQVGLVFRKQNGVIHNNCFTVTPKDESILCREYLFYALNSSEFYTEANNKASGAAQPDLPHGAFSTIPIYLPDIETQHRIASILSAYDDLIENNRRQIKLLEEAAQRLYREWFVDLRFPGHEGVKVVDGVPEGWRKIPAEDFCQISIGKTPPREEKQWFTGAHQGIKWLSIADMGKNSVFALSTTEALTQEAVDKFNVKKCPTGTVLLSFKLTVGRVLIAMDCVTTNEAIAHFRIDDESYREYLYEYLLNYPYDALGSTSSISKAINSKIVKALPIVVPHHDLMERFHRIAGPMFEKVLNLGYQNEKLTTARDMLLPKLMSGEMEV